MSPAFKADGKGGELNPDFKPEVEAAKPAVEEPVKSAEEVKPAAETKPAAEAEAADPNDPFPDFSLEEPSGFGPKALVTALEADPAAAAALEANPELKASIFANARKAERAAKYDEILGSPDEAQVVVAGHTAFSGISNLLSEVKDGAPESVNAVVNAMLDQTAVRDEDGNPVKNPDGTVQTNGTVGRFLKNWFKQRLEFMGEQFVTKNDEEGQQALDILMERAGLRAPSSANEEELSDELKAQKAEIETGKAELDQRRQQQQEADQSASDTRVNSQTDATLDGSVKSILDKATGLDTFSRRNAENEIRKGLRKAIAASVAYRSERQNIEARPLGAKREKALIDLNTRTITEKLPGIARKVLAEAGVSIAGKAAQRKDSQAAREDAARSESRGSLAPTKPAAADTTSIAVVEQDLTAKLGRRPSTQEILAERMNRQSAAAPAR